MSTKKSRLERMCDILPLAEPDLRKTLLEAGKDREYVDMYFDSIRELRQFVYETIHKGENS